MPRDLENFGGDSNPDRPAREDLDRLRGFLSERGEAPGFVKSNVTLGRYDVRLFRELLACSEELRALAKAKDAPDTFGPLLLDMFGSFYKVQPVLLDPNGVDPAHLRANRPFVQRLREDEDTAILRLTTCMDEVASGFATIEAGKKVLDELKRRPELSTWMDRQANHEPPTETPSEVALDAPAPQVSADASPMAESSGKDGSDVPAANPATFDTIDPAPAADLRASVRAASEAASREAGEHAATLRGWGLTPSDLRVVPLGERLELARKLRTRRMKDLADLLGKMRNQRRSMERRKVRANRDEVHSIETSGELSRALPSEIAGAFGSTNPLRRRDFYRRLSERSVLSYSLRSDEPTGRGPVIAMIDASYSMAGEPMEWASAVALALAHAASGAGRGGARRVHAIFFNAQIVLEVEIRPGEKDVRKFLAIGTVEAGGGTEYVPPIARALEIVAGEATTHGRKPGRATADLLLVTDGLCKLPDEFAARLSAEKRENGFGLISVLIGAGGAPGSLEAFSDRIIRASDLARASGARDVAGEVFEGL